MTGRHTVHYRRTDGTEASAVVEGSSWTVPGDCAEITGFSVPGVPLLQLGREEGVMEKCQACDRAARGMVLVKASEASVGAGMARWEPYWTCEVMHRAEHLVPQVQAQDPEALVMALTAPLELQPGYWTMALSIEIATSRFKAPPG